MDLRLPPDFKEFLKLLKEHDVQYLLIGGYAVGYHGYPRATDEALILTNVIGCASWIDWMVLKST
jgi:hypothetical protein